MTKGKKKVLILAQNPNGGGPIGGFAIALKSSYAHLKGAELEIVVREGPWLKKEEARDADAVFLELDDKHGKWLCWVQEYREVSRNLPIVAVSTHPQLRYVATDGFGLEGFVHLAGNYIPDLEACLKHV